MISDLMMGVKVLAGVLGVAVAAAGVVAGSALPVSGQVVVARPVTTVAGTGEEGARG